MKVTVSEKGASTFVLVCLLNWSRRKAEFCQKVQMNVFVIAQPQDKTQSRFLASLGRITSTQLWNIPCHEGSRLVWFGIKSEVQNHANKVRGISKLGSNSQASSLLTKSWFR